MLRNIGHKKYKIYTLAFGYHNDDELLEEFKSSSFVKTSIWDWCLLNEDEMFEGRDNNSLLNQFKEMSKPVKKTSNNICIFTFDLASHLSFILGDLIKTFNLTYKATFEDNDVNVFSITCSESLGDVWSFKIKLHKGSSSIIFKDIEKILAKPKLKELAKALNFDYTSILYDTHINRRVEGFEPSESELKAIRQKAQLLLEVVMYHKDDKYFFKSASAASYSIKKAIDYAYGDKLKPYQEYRKDYPELDLKEDAFVRQSVEGGLTFVNEFYRCKEQEKVLHTDEHNAYPSQLIKHRMPYGKGTYIKQHFDIDKDFDGELFPGCYSVCKCIVSCQFRLVPFRRNLFSDLMYVEIYCWDFELPYLFKCYNYVEVEVEECYVYKTKFSKFGGYFINNYKQRLSERAKGNTYGVMYYKILNNSFYGKVGEKAYKTEIIPGVDSLGNLYVTKRDKEEFNPISTYTYTPMFSCISALQRCEMLDGIFKIGLANYCYCDTDSHFFKMTLETMTYFKSLEHRDFIGCWDDGEILEKAEFVGEKRYKVLTSENDTIVHNAGFTYENGEVYENINLTNDIRTVNTKVRVNGGTLIVPVKKYITTEEDFMEQVIDDTKKHNNYMKKQEYVNKETKMLRYKLSKGFIQREGDVNYEN